MEIDRQEAIDQTKAAISNDKVTELGFQDDYQAVFSRSIVSSKICHDLSLVWPRRR